MATQPDKPDMTESDCWRRATGYYIPVPEGAAREDTLLLRDYAPRHHLVAEDHTPRRARVSAINFHTHFREQDPALLIREMDDSGVAVAVNMGVGTDWTFDAAWRRFVEPYPDRFILFASINWSETLEHENFGEVAAAAFERAARKGARGLKLWKDLGLSDRLPGGELLAIDDARLDPLYAKAQELDLPVCFHTVDPPPFHEPLDRHNARYLEITKHPDWHFYGPGFPDRERVLEQRNRVIERFPGVTFIGAHMGSDSSDLPRLARLLERYPNYHVDMSARVRDLGVTPYSSRRFFIRFADRILFGTDGAPLADHSRVYFRFLETEDEGFRQRGPLSANLCGIRLPDDVLEKVYRRNAERLLKLRVAD